MGDSFAIFLRSLRMWFHWHSLLAVCRRCSYWEEHGSCRFGACTLTLAIIIVDTFFLTPFPRLHSLAIDCFGTTDRSVCSGVLTAFTDSWRLEENTSLEILSKKVVYLPA